MSPQLLEQLRRGAAATQMPQQGKYVWRNGQFVDPTATKKKGGRGGPLTAFISEGGAAGGAALGATLGSVVPGIGTLLGGIAGGAIGGFGGRLAENKVRDDRYGLSQALQEGALSGAFSAIPGGKSVATASGKTGGKLFGMFGDDAVKTLTKKGGAETVENIGKLGKTGNYLRSLQRDITPGMPIKGGELSTEAALAQNKLLDKISKGGKGLTRPNQYTLAEQYEKKLLSQYANSAEAAKKFGKANVDDVVARFEAELAQNPSLASGLDKRSAGVKKALIDDFKKSADKPTKDFIDIVSGKINTRYKAASSGGNKGSIESQVYEAARKATKGHIDDSLMARSKFNEEYATIKGAKENLSKAIGKNQSAGTTQGVGIGRSISAVAGPVGDVLGRGAQQAGRATNTTLARQGVRQVGGRALMGGVGGESVDPMQDAQLNPEDQQLAQLYEQYSGGGDPMQQMNGMGAQQQMPQQSAYSLQDALADLQRATTASQQKQIMDRYDFVSKAEAAQNKGQELTAIQRNKVAGFQTAGEVLNQLESLWQGVKQPDSQLLAGITGLPGVKQTRSAVDANTRQYTQFAEGTLAPIIKSLGETGVLTDRDIIRAYGLVPNLQDSNSVAQNKILQLRQLLTNAQSATSGTNYSPQDDQSELYQALLSSGFGG